MINTVPKQHFPYFVEDPLFQLLWILSDRILLPFLDTFRLRKRDKVPQRRFKRSHEPLKRVPWGTSGLSKVPWDASGVPRLIFWPNRCPKKVPKWIQKGSKRRFIRQFPTKTWNLCLLQNSPWAFQWTFSQSLMNEQSCRGQLLLIHFGRSNKNTIRSRKENPNTTTLSNETSWTKHCIETRGRRNGRSH